MLFKIWAAARAGLFTVIRAIQLFLFTVKPRANGGKNYRPQKSKKYVAKQERQNDPNGRPNKRFH